MEKILKHQEGRKNMVRTEIQAKLTDFSSCTLTSEHRQMRTFIKVATTPGHMTNSRQFDLKELRSYRVCCPNSKWINQKVGKKLKSIFTSPIGQKVWREGKNTLNWVKTARYQSLWDSSSVSRVIHSTITEKDSNLSSAPSPPNQQSKQPSRRKDIIK